MLFKRKKATAQGNGNSAPRKIVKLRQSIYGRVVLIITLLSIFLFVSFSIIFRSVNEQYLNTVIRQNGNNVGSVVQGSLYRSMLENDKSTLQYTLDLINTMSGIDEVNMYDDEDNLVYTSIPSDTNNSHSDPNCISCHANLNTLFAPKVKSYKIISSKSDCQMNRNDNSSRHLLIRLPILNEKSCYLSSCHAHKATDEVLGSLIIKMPLKDLDDAVQKSSLEFFLLATFTTLLLVSFLLIFTGSKIKNPLNDLTRASIAVASGDLSTRLAVKTNQLDDMKVVSHAFNDMLDKLQVANRELENWSQQLEYKVQKKTEELGAAQNELMHVERLASLGKLSSSVAHEINNPLSGILVYTKLLYKQLSNPDMDDEKRASVLKHLKLIETETKRCGDIVKSLLDFSRKDPDYSEPRHLHDILNETIEIMAHPMHIASISFTSDFSAKTDMISCSPNQVKQAIMAILVNATEAVLENGEITMTTSNPEAETIRVDITDNGLGISAEDLPHIFEPFFSTKQDASGIGLGLAIVHGILQSHGARIQVKSELGHGTTVSIFFPLIRN